MRSRNKRMSLEGFFSALSILMREVRKSRKRWRPYLEQGRILLDGPTQHYRGAQGKQISWVPRKCCPVTVLHLVSKIKIKGEIKSEDLDDFDMLTDGQEYLGLRRLIIEDIIDASDYSLGDLQGRAKVMRRRMLRILGLKEKKAA